MPRKHNLTPASVLILFLISAYLLIFLIYPLLYVFKSSLWINGRFSLQFFANILTDDSQRELVVNSFKLAIAVTLTTTFVSLPLAYMLTRYRFPGRSLFQGMILIPMIMPPFVGAIGMKQFFGLYGSINTFLVKAGLVDIADLSPDSFLDWFGGGFWAMQSSLKGKEKQIKAQKEQLAWSIAWLSVCCSQRCYYVAPATPG